MVGEEGTTEDVCPHSPTDTHALTRVHYQQGGSFLTSLFSTCLFQRWRDYQASINSSSNNNNSNSSSNSMLNNSSGSMVVVVVVRVVGMSFPALVLLVGRTKAS